MSGTQPSLRWRLRESGLDGVTLLVMPGVLFVLALFIYPFLYGLVLSFHPKQGGAWANYVTFFSNPYLYDTIYTTLVIAVPVTLLNVVLSVPVALRVRLMQHQRLLTTILVIPITLGTVMVAEGLLTYLGPRGWLNRTLLEFALVDSPIRLVHNYWGVMLSLVITGFPFTFLLTLSYVTGIDPRSSRPARCWGPGRANASSASCCRCWRRASPSPWRSPSCRHSPCSRLRFCWGRRPGRRA